MNPEMPLEDQVALKNMFENLEYFLKKYPGFGFAVTSIVFHNGTNIDIQSRLQLTKMVKVPTSPIVQP